MCLNVKYCVKCNRRGRKHRNLYLTKLISPKRLKKYFYRCAECGYKTKRAFTIFGAARNWNNRKPYEE